MDRGDGPAIRRVPVTIHGVQLVPQPPWPFEAWRRQELGFLTANGFTVPAWDPSARIDYVVASPDLASTVCSSGIPDLSTSGEVMRAVPHRSLGDLLGRKAIKSLGGHASDHLPVWADFRWSSEHGSLPANIRLQPTATGAMMSRRG
jgi:hypothetical protein